VGKRLPWSSLEASDWEHHLDMDLFDYAAGSDAIKTLTNPNMNVENVLHILKRLNFMALSGKL
jgi:hypothetical protein